eukprot:8799818-Pyramimonas_sp.AAC.1
MWSSVSFFVCLFEHPPPPGTPASAPSAGRLLYRHPLQTPSRPPPDPLQTPSGPPLDPLQPFQAEGIVRISRGTIASSARVVHEKLGAESISHFWYNGLNRWVKA